MELKEFVKSVLGDLVEAVEEVRTESVREVLLVSGKDSRTVEFDVAISVEDHIGATGKAGIRVLEFVQAGGDMSHQAKNSTVSRVMFGVHIGTSTKSEETEVLSSRQHGSMGYR